MDVWERVLLALYALLSGLLALFALSMATGWELPLDYLQVILSRSDYRLILGIAAGLVVLIALRFLWAAAAISRSKSGPEQALIQATDLGEVRLAQPAIESMVIRAAKQVKGIREVKVRLGFLPEGVAVKLVLTVLPDRSLPPLTQEVQEAVRRYLTEVAGLEIVEVSVLVDSVTPESVRRVE